MLDFVHQSPHQLVEFITAVAAREDGVSAVQAAAELASEEFDAEIGAVVVENRLGAAVGFGAGEPPAAALCAIRPGLGVADLDGLGRCHVAAASWKDTTPGRLVVGRLDRAFTPEERNLLLGMARGLGLTLRTIEALETERALRAAHQRQAEELAERQRLLEVLLDIQRSISHRAPLQDILDAVTAGAATLLGVERVSLVLDDALDPGRPIVARSVRAASGATPAGDALVASVHVNGQPAGALVAAPPDGGEFDAGDADLLTAFAEHASLALTDAQTVQAMEQAFHDPLTGLPNRALFVERLEQALEGVDAGAEVAVLFVDLDRFKAVNDSIGHAAGDELLRAVAGRIVNCLRSADTAARFGGDEFAVLLEGPKSVASAEGVADRIIAAMRRPFSIAGKTVLIGASVGVAYGDGSARDADQLLRNADLAMYRAKHDGRGRRVAFQPAMLTDVLERVELETALQTALGNGELVVAYQPLVDLEDGRPVAVEALLRWTHPTLGEVAPSTFVSIAEDVGAIVDIGRWALNEACAQAAAIRGGRPWLRMAVNVSAHQIRDPDFPGTVEAALRHHGLPGSALTLELTETLLVDEHGDALAQLLRLRDLGVAIALDDFGTGYSGLRYLQQFPVDVLKIDRSFVALLGDDHAGDDAVVRTIIELGRVMGMRTVAEGIETPAQAERLRALGCRMGQGFLFARPMPGDRLGEWLGRPAPTRSAA
ncbi:MAG TPA: EAL domain-containing protein [Capillimicrobium sp.]|nr:EAL domain-containing protein [Capillimicrobium sp.]